MTNIHRKVFDELALVLKDLPRMETPDGWCFDPRDVIEEIADVLKNNCSTFDKQRFLKACGLQTQEEQEVKWVDTLKRKHPGMVTVADYRNTTRVEEFPEYGYVFDADGNERMMTEKESKEHDEVSVEYVKQYGLENGMSQTEIDAYIANVSKK